ncbi:hypothetical protein HJC23_005311 [Cyclotella cryptica]|uniref:Mannose-P-dolichol utilization defect 1 protein homolog n=1 Tax=Cyclotella cryptica TaxID=29204 RepID=A0ABD3PF92_9STRA|eukprot:CCRYP_015078-RA/>CCRYP_015078-RA protein AED:0.13 eAED:0.13 QI:0/-1/0/1/-1/1/1/0/279
MSNTLADAFVSPMPRASLSMTTKFSDVDMGAFSQISDIGPAMSLSCNLDSSLLVSRSSTDIAVALGYFVGVASLLLYTPIAIRLLRTKSADGLAISTWWCKLTAFTCTDIYNIRSGFPIAAFSETVVITFEALFVLMLVTYYQKQWNETTASLVGLYFALTAWALFSPPNAVWGPTEEFVALAQVVATYLNSAALIPQLHLNFRRRSSGDYSPITAALGSGGCTIRLFTTIKLAGGDPLMLLNYGVALLLNLSVLSQVVYFGTKAEKRSLSSLFLADLS